jgi:hypothetical protein
MSLPDEMKSLYPKAEDMIGKKMMIICDFKGMEDIAVQTTEATIKDAIEFFRNRPVSVQEIFKEYFKRMMCYTKTKDAIYEKGGKDLDCLSDDIMVYYCVRALLFNKAIPIVLCD